MRPTSLLTLLAIGLAGCHNGALAGINPCGGIETSDTEASVGGVPAAGSVTVTDATSAANIFSLSSTADQSCDANILGNVVPDGSSSLIFEVGCGVASVRVTVPDVRFLEAGAQQVLAEITTDNDFHVCATGHAALTVGSTTGASAPGPDFVTADFVRVVSVQLDASGWTANPANAPSDGCPAEVTLDATLEFTKTSFSPAESVTPSTPFCPPLPDK